MMYIGIEIAALDVISTMLQPVELISLITSVSFLSLPFTRIGLGFQPLDAMTAINTVRKL